MRQTDTRYDVAYVVQIGPVFYDRTRDGAPITLAAAWRELDGCGAARILDDRGRVVLDMAGHSFTRRENVRRMAARQRAARINRAWLYRYGGTL